MKVQIVWENMRQNGKPDPAFEINPDIWASTKQCVCGADVHEKEMGIVHSATNPTFSTLIIKVTPETLKS